MKYGLFTELYKEASQCESLDMYIMERGWQEWMNEYTPEDTVTVDTSSIVDILTAIYNIAKTDIRGIREMTGKSMKKFATFYGIPERTLQDWEYGNSRMPEYTKRLIAYTVFAEGKG